eukprot:CAMPEP_0204821734 /NCGR_PEP_ID=MMETSP1018-20131115/108997_1 /ASSEMBLY_ACC=CAM_ASM_000518 /TAXON_ID=46462 /ORGANISM="Anophryoides haemophila, Strain AH6" /LENGTH=54 /DNA_ID=CAMNT_0051945939 /DNA_START=378 /DNA_END=542 /DNA_ORIENTATION=+
MEGEEEEDSLEEDLENPDFILNASDIDGESDDSNDFGEFEEGEEGEDDEEDSED